jgi:hypothetical protein
MTTKAQLFVIFKGRMLNLLLACIGLYNSIIIITTYYRMWKSVECISGDVKSAEELLETLAVMIVE